MDKLCFFVCHVQLYGKTVLHSKHIMYTRYKTVKYKFIANQYKI